MPRGRVVGQIFFATAKHHLDGEARRALGELGRAVGRASARRRVQFAAIGHADHRGRQPYNRDLGARRAGAVLAELYRRVPASALFDGYSLSWPSLDSRGEQSAAQGTRDPDELALDRRVDLYDVYASPKPPPPAPAPKLERVTLWKFRYTTHEPLSFDPKPDPTGEGVEALAELILGPAIDRAVPTDRVLTPSQAIAKGRQVSAVTAKLPLSDRVNRIVVEIDSETRFNKGTRFDHRHTTLRLVWGSPPARFVQLQIRYPGGRRVTTHLPRPLVDRDPLLNPVVKRR